MLQLLKCYPTFRPSTYVPTYLPTFRRTTYLPTYLPSTYIPTYLPSVDLHTYLPTYLPSTYIPTYLPTFADYETCKNTKKSQVCKGSKTSSPTCPGIDDVEFLYDTAYANKICAIHYLMRNLVDDNTIDSVSKEYLTNMLL